MIAETTAIAPQGGHSEILAALKSASAQTGSDFDYLLATAKRESSLDSDAKSKTSSAAGLFQFVDQTWLGLIKQFGERHGLGAYAKAIEANSKGHLSVASSDAKAAILALRQNPALSALMAGEAASQTKQSLEGALGRDVCAGELYAAHFLGQGGACRLIRLNESDPTAPADQAFPQAAKANRGVFYDADGTPKSVGEVYAWAVDLPDAKTGGANAKPNFITTIASHRGTPGGFARAETDRMTVFSPRRIARSEARDDSQSAAHRVYTPALPLAKAPPPSANGLPQPPLLLDAGIMAILARMTPANPRRSAG